MSSLRIWLLPVALLLGACGGDDDGGAADGDSDFCERALEFMEGGAFDDPSTDAALAAIEEADEVEAPEEISDDWQILIDGVRALAEIDPNLSTEEAEAELPPEVQDMGPASTNVFNYLSEECDLDAEG